MNNRKHKRIPLPGPEGRTQLLLLVALFVSCLFIFRSYLFGDQLLVFRDVGGDTCEQYVMHYASIVNHLRDGSFSFWDFTNGFGTNQFNLSLFDPSLMLLYLLGVLLGPAHMLIYLVWIQIWKVLLAGWVFYWFLREFPLSRTAKFLAAFAYGLNGYLLVWGQHYQFGMITIYLPLMLLFCEKFVKKEKGRGWFPVTVFLCGIYSVYLTYMSMVAVGFYLLFRVAMEEERTGRERVRKFLVGCGAMLLGLGMSMVIFLPMASVILNVSSRLNAEEMSILTWLKECFTLYPVKFYETLCMRLFSTNLQNYMPLGGWPYAGFWNYYEDPVIFCSSLAVFLNVQFVVNFWRSKESKRKKAAVYGACLLILITMLLPIGGTVFNAFLIPTQRYTFVLIPIFLLVMAWMWDELRAGGRMNVPALLLTFLAMNWSYRHGYEQTLLREYKNNEILLGVLGEIMTACLLALALVRNQQLRKVMLGLVAATMIVGVISEGGVTYQARITLRKQDTTAEELDEAYERYYEELTEPDGERQARAAFIKPQDYFRELYREDLQEILQYLKEKDPEFYRVEKDFMSATVAMDSLAQGYRGISTYNSTLNGNLKEFVDLCYPEFYCMDYNRLAFWQNAQNHWFASFAGVRYLVSRDEDLDESRYKLLGRFGDLYLYENAQETSMIKFFENAISTESFQKLCTWDTRQELLKAVVALDDGPEILSMEELQKLKKDENASGEVKAVLDAPVKDSLVTGRVQSSRDGYVMFMIPYEQGWSLKVDGEETALVRGDIGFLACHVEAGEHELELTFHAPGLKMGALLSILFWILFLGLQIFRYRRERKQEVALSY